MHFFDGAIYALYRSPRHGGRFSSSDRGPWNQAQSGPPHAARHLLPYVLVLPIILYECAMIVYPIAQGVYGSFQRIELASNKPADWVGSGEL